MENICVLVCSNHEREIREVLASSDFDGVSYGTYPSQKGIPPLNWQDVGRVISQTKDCQHFCLFGGCCVPAPGNVPAEFDHVLVSKVDYCVKVLADGPFLDYLTEQGAYVISPGWLSEWQKNVQEMGLTADTVGAFNDSVQEMILLDTGIAPDAATTMKECAAFFRLPYQIIPIGLDHFRAHIAALVLEKRHALMAKSHVKDSARTNRELAEYIMTLDVTNELATSFSEGEVIQKTLNLLTSILSPEQALYLPVIDGVFGEIVTFPEESDHSDESRSQIIERLSNTSDHDQWSEHSKSFAFKIVHNINVLGYFELSHIAFPEFSSHYKNIAKCIVDVCALALNNARSFQQIQEKTRLLQASEAKVNLILENAGEGIYGLDKDGHTTFANKAAVNILGYNLEEMTGASQHELIHHSLPDGTPYLREHCSVVASLTDGTVHTEDDEVYWHKNGTAIPVEYSSAPLLEDDGEISGAVVVFKDITERKKAEDALRAVNLELEEFAYRTSHDLRSPLSSSSNLIEMASKFIDSGDTQKAKECVDFTGKSLAKLDVLVQDILALTKAKNLDEESAPVSIKELVDSALEKFSHMDNYARISFVKEYDDLPIIATKPSRITLIVDNLISNAIKYQDTNKQISTIKITSHITDSDFIFRVEDNGLGVPEEHQDKLFTMFKRFHANVSFGTGLGLYMMKKSADIIGGKLSFQDNGSGSTFQVQVPKELVLLESDQG
ncbi:MAG: ATP-binding protein [Spongiibacteraceae bacterium]